MSASIMVVEDEAVVALELQECLVQLGYAVPATVATGEEAISRALSEEPDLVLMDIKLKGRMDGVEAGKKIMEERGIPVVYLTAYSDDTTVQRAKDTAPFGYVLKPWEDKSLQIAIEMALRKSHHEKDIRRQRDWYHTVLRFVGSPMIVCDLKGTIQFVNASAEQLVGMGLRDGIGGAAAGPSRSVHDLVKLRSRQDGSEAAIPVTDSVLAGRTHHSRALMLVAADGSTIPVDMTVAPIADADSAAMGFALLMRPEDPDSAEEPTARARNAEWSGVALREFLQIQLIRILLLQQSDPQASDRFVEGQLEAYRSVMLNYFETDAAVPAQKGFQSGLVRRAIRDTCDEIRRIWTAGGDNQSAGTISSDRFARYLSALVRRLIDSAGLDPADIPVGVDVLPAALNTDSAILSALIVNELVGGVVEPSAKAREPIELTLRSAAAGRLQLVIAHAGGLGPPAGLGAEVLDALVSAIGGSLQQDKGATRTVWTLEFPNPS